MSLLSSCVSGSLLLCLPFLLSACGSGPTVTLPPTSSPPPVPTVTLAFDPVSVLQGAKTTLAWASTGATACQPDKTGSALGLPATLPASGSTSLAPAMGAYSVTLTCSGPGGTGTATATVSVLSKIGGVYRLPTRSDTPQDVACLIAASGAGKCFTRDLASPATPDTVYSIAPITLDAHNHFDVTYTSYTTQDASAPASTSSTTPAPSPATVTAQPLLAAHVLGKGTATGTLTPGVSLDVTFTGTDGTHHLELPAPGKPLPWDAVDSKEPASLDALAGTYWFQYTGAEAADYSGTLTFDNAGTVTGVEYTPVNCTFSGTVGGLDAALNVYPMTLARTCSGGTGTTGTLPVSFDVLATLFQSDESVPPRLLLVATGGDRSGGAVGGGKP